MESPDYVAKRRGFAAADLPGDDRDPADAQRIVDALLHPLERRCHQDVLALDVRGEGLALQAEVLSITAGHGYPSHSLPLSQAPSPESSISPFLSRLTRLFTC